MQPTNKGQFTDRDGWTGRTVTSWPNAYPDNTEIMHTKSYLNYALIVKCYKKHDTDAI